MVRVFPTTTPEERHEHHPHPRHPAPHGPKCPAPHGEPVHPAPRLMIRCSGDSESLEHPGRHFVEIIDGTGDQHAVTRSGGRTDSIGRRSPSGDAQSNGARFGMENI